MHPRREQALQAARVWADAHKSDALRDANGRHLPGEIQGVKIKGIARLSASDGRIEHLPWGTAPATKEIASTINKKTGNVVYKKARQVAKKNGPSDGSAPIAYRDHQGPTVEQIKRETQLDALGARRQAESQVQRYGALKETTIVLGEKLPQSLRVYGPVSRQTRVVRLSALDRVSVDPETGRTQASGHGEILVDRRRLQQVAAQELEEILELNLTEKEVRSLRQRANRTAVTDRHTLKRAQAKAQAALAGV